MFSRTTIQLSSKTVIATTRPPSVKMLIEKLSNCIKKNVPSKVTGKVSETIKTLFHPVKKNAVIRTTSSAAIKAASRTPATAARMYSAWS